jgi:hypothetical protein
MIYLLTAIGLPPGGSSTVHNYIQTTQRTTQNKQYIEQHKNLEDCWPCSIFVGYTLAFALQMRKKTWKNLSQGSQRVPDGTMKIHKRTIGINRHNDENI